MSITTVDNSIEGPPTEPLRPAAHAAQRSDYGWVVQVTALSAVLGVMLALAIRTTSQIENSTQRLDRLSVSSAFLSRFQDQNENLQDEIKDLRRQVSDIEASVQTGSRSTEQLKKQLQDIKVQAGFSPVEGPGLTITLSDSPEPPTTLGPADDYSATLYRVHDQDINNVIAELKAAGAQHLAVSGADVDNLQRVIVKTTARCVGPTAVVNGTPLSAPYHILAIGDAATLRAALERPDGFIHSRGLDVRKMVQIEDSPRLALPEYSGFTTKHAKPIATN